jgi:hypothetical protein
MGSDGSDSERQGEKPDRSKLATGSMACDLSLMI